MAVGTPGMPVTNGGSTSPWSTSPTRISSIGTFSKRPSTSSKCSTSADIPTAMALALDARCRAAIRSRSLNTAHGEGGKEGKRERGKEERADGQGRDRYERNIIGEGNGGGGGSDGPPYGHLATHLPGSS